jgi:hypothetical protein
MTNREKMIAAIRSGPVDLMNECCERKLIHDEDADAMREWPDYDLADAFRDVMDAAESLDDPVAKRLARKCNDLLIAVGHYVERDASEVVVTLGRDSCLRRGGKKYDCVEGWATWIEG